MLRDLTDRYPETKLHPIPSLPEVLVKEEKHRFFYASKEPSELLQSLQLTGYLLCDMSLECNELSLGNIFIPHQSYSETLDQLCQVVIFKNVVQFNNNTFENLRESVEYQLNLILAKIEEWIRPDCEQDSKKIPVKVVLLSAPKFKQLMETLIEDMRSHFQDNFPSKHFSVLVHTIARSKRNNGKDEATYAKLILDNGSNSNWVSEVLVSFIMHTVAEKLPEISNRKFIFPSEKSPTLCFNDASNEQQVIELFALFFPAIERRVEFLPDINRIPSRILNKTNHLAGLKNADDYIGEVKMFLEIMIYKLETAKGVLIYDYRETHSNTILNQKLKNFQFDWILCSPQTGFTIFEIVRNRNPENASSAVENKLTGQCTSQLYVLRLFLFAILRPVFQGTETDVLNWIENHTRLVVVFSNATVTVVNEAVEKHSKSIVSSSNQLSSTFILPLSDLENVKVPVGSYELLKLDKSSKLVKSGCRIADIFDQFDGHYLFEGKNYLDYSCAVICLSYLSNALPFDQISEPMPVQKPSREPMMPEERFEKPCRYLDIILTPQQNQLLKEDPRYLYIIGEPGSGKTSLLLAKAVKTVQERSDIEKVYFVLPPQKTLLRESVEESVRRYTKRDPRMRKIEFISLHEIFESSIQPTNETFFSMVKLHHSILLVDELYFESTDTVAKGDEDLNWFRFFEVLYHAKQCWIANLQAGQMHTRRNIYHKIFPPNFQMSALNILLRNAHHISAFSTSFIHRTKTITMSSARIPGCFISSQRKIPHLKFSKKEQVSIGLETIADPVFDQNRRAIVFSDRSDYWTNAIDDKVVSTTIVSTKSNFISAPYTGCEAQSVIIVIDDLPHEVHDKRTFGVITLAITRAQYEVCVFANEKCFKRVQQFLSYKNTHIEKAMFDAANSCRFSCKFDDYSKWDNDTHNLATSLIQIAIQTSNAQLFDDIVDLYPGHDGHKPLPMKKILSSFDCPKPQKFMDHLTKRIGKQTGSFFEWMIRVNRFPKYFPGSSHVSDTVDSGIAVGYTCVVDWYFALISQDQVKNLLKRYKRTLFSACKNGRYSTLRWAFDKLASFSLDHLKENELRQLYFWYRDDATLLLVLCYARCELDAIELLFQEGFPNELLLETYLGKNVLQVAIEYEDQELISLLLRCTKRRNIFFSSEAKYAGFSNPVEYAKFLKFEEIAELLSSYSLSLTA